MSHAELAENAENSILPQFSFADFSSLTLTNLAEMYRHFDRNEVESRNLKQKFK